MKILRSFIAAVVFSVFSLAVFAAPVNVNTAGVSALTENIVGVGPKLADRIVKYRSENGAFKSIDDLSNVKGIGPKLIEKNKENLLLDDVKK